MKNINKDIRAELLRHVEAVYRDGAVRFFKEEVRPLGVRTPKVRKIARDFFPKGASKSEIFELCEQLLERKTFEETIIAFAWARRMEKHLQKKDYARFERWLKTYVDNWAFCDDFCTHAFGALINKYPELQERTKKWARSKNRWLRRASAVILIHPYTKPNQFLDEVFEIADILLEDKDDLVQKGYGWMLKVAADHHQKHVFDFVMKNKKRMPRTALRYAIEKMPAAMRKHAMAKD